MSIIMRTIEEKKYKATDEEARGDILQHWNVRLAYWKIMVIPKGWLLLLLPIKGYHYVNFELNELCC